MARLAARGEGYYLAQVVSGAEDYYSEWGSSPGLWRGSGTADLGLMGEVDGDDLRRVLAGSDPSSGEGLGIAGRRTPGFDLVFRAPKSVSLLWALGDRPTTSLVAEAHEEAVSQALGYLERRACWVRRGSQGRQQLTADGFVGASFRHSTSRAGDPLLHTHVLVANVARGPDGRWSALDGRALFAHGKTAGYLYQAALRDELTRRLGVAWLPVKNGHADLVGIDRTVVRAFSRRRAAIEVAMAARGESSARAAQIATLATRPKKAREDISERIGAWREEAERLGCTRAVLAAVCGRASWMRPVPDRTAEDLVGADGLTGGRSTFDRRDVIQAWCNALGAGAPAPLIEAFTDDLLGSRLVQRVAASPLEAGWRESFRRSSERVLDDGARFSTEEMVAVEAEVLDGAAARAADGVAIAEPAAVEAALALRPSLSGEQQAMIRRLTSSGAGVELVVGKAGTGKTMALDAARAAWQASGHVVVGCALAARAAAELEAGAGIPSATIHRLLGELSRTGLSEGAVLVVDEAGMAGTRTLAALLRVADRDHAKVVLVGDDRQLPSIDAGGAFRGLRGRLDPIELWDNHRQTHGWERHALDQLRHGNPIAAVDAYRRHGRLTIAATTEATRELLVEDWLTAVGQAVDGRMLALRRADVADLNARARVRLVAAGRVSTDGLSVGDVGFGVGDRVVACRNDYRLGVLNGTTGQVVEVDKRSRSLTVEADDGRRIRLPAAYLDAGHLQHGYALTVHKAQGATYETAFVLGDDRLYREAGYVALSRGRTTRLYAVGDIDEEHHRPQQPDPLDTLQRAVRRVRSEPPVTELLPREAGRPARDPALAALQAGRVLRRRSPVEVRDRWAQAAAAVAIDRSRLAAATAARIELESGSGRRRRDGRRLVDVRRVEADWQARLDRHLAAEQAVRREARRHPDWTSELEAGLAELERLEQEAMRDENVQTRDKGRGADAVG